MKRLWNWAVNKVAYHALVQQGMDRSQAVIMINGVNEDE